MSETIELRVEAQRKYFSEGRTLPVAARLDAESLAGSKEEPPRRLRVRPSRTREGEGRSGGAGPRP